MRSKLRVKSDMNQNGLFCYPSYLAHEGAEGKGHQQLKDKNNKLKESKIFLFRRHEETSWLGAMVNSSVFEICFNAFTDFVVVVVLYQF